MAEEKETFFRQNSELIVFTVLTALVIFIYGQTVGFGFINFDDNQYVYENPFVINGLNWIGNKMGIYTVSLVKLASGNVAFSSV